MTTKSERTRKRRASTASEIPDSVLAAVTSSPWLITSAGLNKVLAIVSRSRISPEALAAYDGELLENSRTVTIRDGVATIPVRGALVRYASIFSEISGATSYSQLARDHAAALTDPLVHTILFDFDTPGGEVNGCSELAGLIRAGSLRNGGKQTIAYGSNTVCSAGYWLASACDVIVASPTAVVGCIGARMTYLDTSVADRRDGIRYVEIVSEQTPNKALDPGTPDGLAQCQRMVNDLAAVFIADLAANRNEDPEQLADKYGAGDVFVGARAVDAGLADRLGTYEALLAELSAPAVPALAIVPAAARAAASTSARSAIAPGGTRTNNKELAAMSTNRKIIPAAALALGAPSASAFETETSVRATVASPAVAVGDVGVVVETADGFSGVRFGDDADAAPAWLRDADLEAADAESAEAAPGDAPAETPTETTTARARVAVAQIPAGISTVEQLTAHFGPLVASIRETAATAERDRVFGILALNANGLETEREKCARTPGVTPADAALAILNAQSTGRKTRIAAILGDEQRFTAPAASGGEPGDPNSVETIVARILTA